MSAKRRKFLYILGTLSWVHVAFYCVVWMVLLFYDIQIINELLTYIIGIFIIIPGILVALICARELDRDLDRDIE
jgi:hypothetical protein